MIGRMRVEELHVTLRDLTSLCAPDTVKSLRYPQNDCANR